MKSRNFAESLKNAMGTVFLLAGAFFVCSTLVSIRAVFADPIAPVVYSAPTGGQSPRATNSRRANAASTVNRGTSTNAATTTGRSARAAASRTVTARTAVATPRAATSATPTATRGTATRAVRSTRAVPSTSRAASATQSTSRVATPTRNVVARTGTTTRTTATRNVRSRSAVVSDVDARVSLQGSAIRGSKRGNGTTSYTYLSNKLYTGDYSNIIDSQTGLISADAYSNCLESYYTCMDEICTARNATQGRCSCANRTLAFKEAERALEVANEELITISGELALLVATKGKDVSSAFKLTDAEKIMNCAAYAEVVASDDKTEITEWCAEHTEFVGSGNDLKIETCSATKAPTYCATMGAAYDFNLADLGSTSSDILASFRAWAKAKDSAKEMVANNNTNLLEKYTNTMDIVSGMNITTTTTNDSASDLDDLANTWGYELFGYAHNHVCGRVLDSCFNGIYEACGNPPSNIGRCATSASSSCPYNYNSNVAIDSNGEVALIDRSNAANKTYSSSANSASCFGYSTTSDPYAHLRGPVADARRSIMQKYLLDANASCDVYGEQLRATAQNIGYQKVAAQQSLQQMRLEFAIEEEETTLADAIEAGTNFDECISEIIDCYENLDEDSKFSKWTEARKVTYCSQIAEVPSCYETMICNPSTAQFRAVIDVPDSNSCNNSQDYKHNTCRNIVTLNEILKGTGVTAAPLTAGGTGSSAALREQCLLDAGVDSIRQYNLESRGDVDTLCSVAEMERDNLTNARTAYKSEEGGKCYITACNPGYILRDGKCDSTEYECSIENAKHAVAVLESGTFVRCEVRECEENYNPTKDKTACVAETRTCDSELLDAWNAADGDQTWLGNAWSGCVISDCKLGYTHDENKCVLTERECTPKNAENVESATQKYDLGSNDYGECTIQECNTGFELSTSGDACVANPATDDTPTTDAE